MWLNMTLSHRGGRVEWGKANRDGRVNVDLQCHNMHVSFARLIQMCRFDCANTLSNTYKFCGKVNRRRFGVPMGGFMSPALAILCYAMIEYSMTHLDELVGFVVQYNDMHDVFGIYAVSNDAEEWL